MASFLQHQGKHGDQIGVRQDPNRWRWSKGIVELASCGVAELRSCGVAELRSCGVTELKEFGPPHTEGFQSGHSGWQECVVRILNAYLVIFKELLLVGDERQLIQL